MSCGREMGTGGHGGQERKTTASAATLRWGCGAAALQCSSQLASGGLQSSAVRCGRARRFDEGGADLERDLAVRLRHLREYAEHRLHQRQEAQLP